MNEDPILLSAPDVGEAERTSLLAAFDEGWIAPAGPQLDAFELELREYTGAEGCVALSSGTAALHLALLGSGIQRGDEVVVQSATFAASAFAAVHAGAKPVFIDSAADTWCLDPQLLEEFLTARADGGNLPKAVMPVDLYGSTADYAAIIEVCERFDVAIIRDAAEALGSISTTGAAGALRHPTVVSFNGNKIITTSSGGALLGSPELIERSRYLSTQARRPELHYEHTDIGFNYRMSNLLAAIGRAQLANIESKIERRAEIAERYRAGITGAAFCPFATTPRPNHWLSVAMFPNENPLELCRNLQAIGIHARPAWKPMHQQPVFKKSEFVAGSGTADRMFAQGVCLPSGSGMADREVERVIEGLARMRAQGRPS